MSDPILDAFDNATGTDEEDPILSAFTSAQRPKSVAEAARERLLSRGIKPNAQGKFAPVDADANRLRAMSAPDVPVPKSGIHEDSWGASRAVQAHGAIALLRGAGKGVIETASNLARELPVTSGIGLVGQIPAVKKFVNDPDLPAALEPSNPAEAVGKFAERVGEFTLGSGAASTATKAAPAVAAAAKAFPRAANIATNAAVGGAVTGAQGGDPVTGAAIGGAFSAAGELAGPLSRALIESAKKSYMRTLGATKEVTKNLSGRVVGGYDVAGQRMPGLIERGVMAFTRKGLNEKAATEVAALGDQIDTLWSAIPAGQTVPATQIQAALSQAKAGLTQTGPAKSMTVKLAEVLPTDQVVSINAASGVANITRSTTVNLEPAAVRNLDRIQKMIDSLTDDAGQVDVHQLRRVKQVFDDVVAGRGGYAGKQLSIADQGGVLARREAADAIREQLASAYPDIAAVNREFHFWKTVEGVLGETLKRTSSQSQPMGQQIARVAGAAAAKHTGTGSALLVGEAAGLFRKLTTSAAWNTTSAIAKDRLAQMLASGQADGAKLLMHSMLAGASAATQQEPSGDAAIKAVADRYFGGNIAAAEKYLRDKGAL